MNLLIDVTGVFVIFEMLGRSSYLVDSELMGWNTYTMHLAFLGISHQHGSFLW